MIILVLMIDFLLFHDLDSIARKCEHLFPVWSFFLLLSDFIASLPPLTGEQYGKMEPQYAEGGNLSLGLDRQCRSFSKLVRCL